MQKKSNEDYKDNKEYYKNTIRTFIKSNDILEKMEFGNFNNIFENSDIRNNKLTSFYNVFKYSIDILNENNKELFIIFNKENEKGCYEIKYSIDTYKTVITETKENKTIADDYKTVIEKTYNHNSLIKKTKIEEVNNEVKSITTGSINDLNQCKLIKIEYKNNKQKLIFYKNKKLNHRYDLIKGKTNNKYKYNVLLYKKEAI